MHNMDIVFDDVLPDITHHPVHRLRFFPMASYLNESNQLRLKYRQGQFQMFGSPL